MKKITSAEVEHTKKVIEVLRDHPYGLWIREIARRSGLHMEQVRRVVSAYPELFEEYADFTTYGINLKIIRLKRRVSTKNLERLLEILKQERES